MNDRKDFEQVVSLTEDKPIDDAGNSSILQAYNYFQEKIDVNKVDVDELLSHLIFIDIELHPNDDEQAIFDTINSLGVRLTTAELLKNYFLQKVRLRNTKNYGCQSLKRQGHIRILEFPDNSRKTEEK